jgi:hypothetical protein
MGWWRRRGLKRGKGEEGRKRSKKDAKKKLKRS